MSVAENYLWDKETPDDIPDAENPFATVESIASVVNTNNPSPVNTRRNGNSLSSVMVVKLGLVLAAIAAAVALSVIFTRNKSSENDVAAQVASASVSYQNSMSDIQGAEPKDSEYFTSSGPLGAKVKFTSSSIINGYETCSSLERDITEAIKLYIDDFINDEAIRGEIYAHCDPDNENWWWDVYGPDYDYSYYDYEDEYMCSLGSNGTSCATDSSEVPWVLTWHVNDHAEGKIFYNETDALTAYYNVHYMWAKRLYDPSKTVVEEYGGMSESLWCQLETWAYDAQCDGEAPVFANMEVEVKANVPLPKQMRSSIPIESQIPKSANSKEGKRGKKGGKPQDSFGQNSQSKGVNGRSHVVSDGTYIYSAYGDVLYTWLASNTTQTASITHMPDTETECDLNVREPCTSTTKPHIEALFLSKTRLTVIVSWASDTYPIPDEQPIVTTYGKTAVVMVYDISDITLGSPLTEVGYKELTGVFLDGHSVGDNVFIATKSFIDTSLFTHDLSRHNSEYCGLDTASYKELAAITANGRAQLFVKQIASELELVNDCSRMFQISMKQDSSNDLTGADLLETFVQVSSFDMSTDFGSDNDIPMTKAGSFTAGLGIFTYLADDFLALPSSIYRYNATSGASSHETFILGFNLSPQGATPCCYGHIPGELGNNYRMDKHDNLLRIITYGNPAADTVNWSPTQSHKIYVLEIPSNSGTAAMAVGESEELLYDPLEYIDGGQFFGDKAYISASSGDWIKKPKKELLVVNLSNHIDPQVIGSLEIHGSLDYMHRINIGSKEFILGIGYGTNYTTWDMFMAISLIDISAPSSPKLSAFYKETWSRSHAASDFHSFRYLDDSRKLIIPVSKNKENEHGYNELYMDGFVVYDISRRRIAPAFNVTYSTEESFCYYNAQMAPRSFVIESVLTTIYEHTAINTDMKSGRYVSELDLDDGLNYSVCDTWDYFYYDYGHYHSDYLEYNDDGGNSTGR